MKKTIKLKIKGIKGEKGDTPSTDELVSIITPLIPEPIKGEKGEKPTTNELIELISPLIPEPIKGDDGYTPIKGVDYFDGAKGERGLRGFKGEDGKDVDENVINDIQAKVNRALDISSRDYDLSELKDVSITNPTNGQVPVYNSTTGKWENDDIATGGVQSVVAGTNVTVDDTDPANPIVSVDIPTPTVPNLQEVTDVGAITTNTTTFSPSGNNKAIIANGSGSGVGIDITHAGSGTKLKIGTTGSGDLIDAGDFNVDKDGDTTVNELYAEKLGLGTTTPLARRLHTVNPTATYTTITGTITSISTVVFVANVTGSGTLFTSEFKVGDLLVHPTLSHGVTVVKITSDTSMQVYGTALSGTTGANYRRLDRTNAVIDTGSVTMNTEAYGQFNTFTGASNVPTRILNGITFFQNMQATQHGLIIESFANDGRMVIKHSESTNANIIFQHGNANIGINYATLSNALWSMPLYLGLASFGSNQTGIYMERSGTGANQQIRQWTTRFAVHGDAPSFQMSANGLDFGRRDGSVWNEGIDAITMSMDKTTGRWKFGSFGTSTPTGATSRVHIVETNGYEQLRLETPYTPTSSADTNGETGQVVWDDDYVHIKTSTGWKKAPITTSGSGGGGMTQGQVLARTLGA